MASLGVRIVPISETPWADVEQVFGTRGDPAGCWCQYFKMANAQWQSTSRQDLSARLHEQTERGKPPPGLVAYLDGEPVGWCAVEPRPRYPRILTSKVVTLASTEPLDDSTVWAVTCFVVRVGYRRRGVSTALIASAVDWARENGARVLEGYPVDSAVRPKASSADLYHGTVGLFQSAGFSVAAQPVPGRALMRLEL